MKVITSAQEYPFNLDDRKSVFVLASTLSDSKLYSSAVASSDGMNFQDRQLKVAFSGRELELIKALETESQPNDWPTQVKVEMTREGEYVIFEPKDAEATLFVLQKLLLICKDLLKWFKQKPGSNLERKREPQTITVRSHEGRIIETFTF